MMNYRQQRNRPGTAWTRLRTDRRGIAMPMMAILFGVLLAFLGLVLDGGHIYFEKRRMQFAADAGSYAGAQEVMRGNSGRVESAARTDAGLNGYPHGTETKQVDVYNPPISGTYTGNSGFVEVVVSETVPTYFMRILNFNEATVRTRAVSGVVNNGDLCVLALDPSRDRSLRVTGTPRLETDCEIQVNSDSTRALEVNGAGELVANCNQFAAGDCIGVTGEPRVTGGGYVSPNPVTGVTPTPDPFALRPQPVQGDFMLSATAALAANPISSNVTLQPGYYPNPIVINGGTVLFEEGVYYLQRGFRATGGTIRSQGAGTSFYNYNQSGNDFFDIGGNVQAYLSAWSGTTTNVSYHSMDNILFWNNRNTTPRSPGHLIRGTSGTCWGGVVYIPTQHLDFAGNTSTGCAGYWTMIIANTIDLSGTSGVQVITSPPDGLIPELTTVTMVE
jgi:Flp pilus assembly protein TadG